MRIYLLAIILYLSMAPQVAGAAPLLCEDIFHVSGGKIQVSAEGSALVSGLIGIPEIAGPLVNPKDQMFTWNSFDALNSLRSKADAYALKLITLNPTERATELRNFLRLVDENPVARDIVDAMAAPQTMEYLPAQYHLRKNFYLQLSKALSGLPHDFRFPVGRVPRDQRLAKINKEARVFLREQEVLFEKTISSTGFSDYAAYEKAVRSSADPVIQRAVKLIDQHQLDVFIRRPESGRFWIPMTGFQNQHVSGSSKGYMDKDGRNGVESLLTDRNKADYAQLDNELKPKYGSLRVKDSSGVNGDISGSNWYGSDVYTLKEEVIQDRLTVFVGDSLDYYNNMSSSWAAGRTAPVNTWDGMFIPWSRRLLIVPYMIELLKYDRFYRPSYSATAEIPMRRRQDKSSDYWEAQIFGRVTLDMVKTFEFEKNPPSGEFLAELKKHGIKIIDRRANPPVEWIGD